ncbi:MAG: hypothetical protein KDC49_14660 [Saprospiraceae bacterium]|nr:hypothetical protein [Saprospiraceae bacterium]
MKNFFTLFLLLSSTFTLSSQLSFENIDISKFRYADARFRSLDLNLYQAANTNHFDNFNFDNSRNSNFNFNGGLNSYNFRNTRRLQQNSNFGFNFFSQKTSERSTFDHNISLNWRLESRHYRGNKFWEIAPSIGSNSDISNHATVNLSLGLKRGKGRLEPVDDVYLLRWIAKDLEEEGISTSDWNEETIFDLANKINIINNYRLFDSRRQIKTQLKDASLLIGDQLGDQNLNVYATVFDNFTGSIRGNRQEGIRKAFGLRPYYFRAFRGQRLDPNFFGLELSADYLQSKNTSLNFQKIREVKVGIDYRSSQNYVSFDNYNTLSPFISGLLAYDYFPNSRTSIRGQAGVRLGAEYSVLNPSGTANFSGFSYEASMGLSANYFINYQTRLRFSVSFGFNGLTNNGRYEDYFAGFSNQLTFLHSFY